MPDTEKGITLIELVVAMTLAALLLALAAPSFATLIKDNRLVTQVHHLASALQLARSEAIKRGTRITVCKSTNQTSCAIISTITWQSGWIAFVDDGATIGSFDGGEQLLRVSAAATTGIALSESGFDDWISYLPTGNSTGSDGLAQGHFLLCDDRGDNYARKISINLNGRVNTQASVSTGEC